MPRPSFTQRLSARLDRLRRVDSTTWLTVVLVGCLAAAGILVVVSHSMTSYTSTDDLAADVSRVGARPVTDGPSTASPDAYRPVPARTIHRLSPAKMAALLRSQRLKAEKVLRQDMAARGLVPVPVGASQPTTFTVSSFNVLGAGHTTGRGARGGYQSGVERMRAAGSLIASHGVSVVGLQEFQAPQYQTFQAILGGSYDVWPGLSLGQVAVQNSIAWRSADWEMIDGSTTAIPYFGGNPVPMPHVLLRNRHTGQNVWFANYHNPADAHGPAQSHRVAATSLQVALTKQLTADGTPMVITGDMNERDGYACRLSSGAPTMHSADGAGFDGGCVLPSRMNVDWIFGSRDVGFSDFIADFSPKERHISDHPMIRSTATVAAATQARGCVQSNATDQWFCPQP